MLRMSEEYFSEHKVFTTPTAQGAVEMHIVYNAATREDATEFIAVEYDSEGEMVTEIFGTVEPHVEGLA